MMILVVALTIPFFATPVSAAYENTYTNTGNMRDDIIGVALTQVGYTEGSNNYTKYGVWYGLSNSPWCGMFVSWCANEAGIPSSVLKRTGLANPKNFGLSYQSGNEYTPQKGDLFFKKNFSHVGLVYYTEGDYFYTLEGNTSTTSYDGNCVMIRKRKISDFYFSSPSYSGSSNSGCSHDYEVKVEADHPHKEFKLCSKCGKKSYTGVKVTSDNCKTCIQEACDHSFNSWAKTSDSKHSRICTKCDIEESKSHNWENGTVVKEATCVAEGQQQISCKDCGSESVKSISPTGVHIYTDFSYIDESNHQKVCKMCNEQTVSEHTLSNHWKQDNLYHWTSCSECNGHIRHEEHVFSNGCTEPCDICGFTLSSGHKVDDELYNNEDLHWEICVRCNQEVNHQNHIYASDCDEDCNNCGYIRKTTTSHNDIYYSDASGHKNVCSTCERETQIVSHIPDRSTKDWEDQHCIHCGFEMRSSENHEHVYATIDSDATSHWGACPCGEILEPEVHSWDFQTSTCSICGVENKTVQTGSSGNFFIDLWNHIWKKK
jgi:hypothetical protein